MILILFSIILLVLETILEATPETPLCRLCTETSLIITLIFVIELSIRFITYRNKISFFRSYWLDILAVLPILRPFRIFRVLRLLRIFRMGLLMNRRIFSVTHLFREGVKEYIILFYAIIAFVLAGAIGIRLLEGTNPAFNNLPDAAWWAAMSMIAGEPMTEMPASITGKLITIMLMMSGLTFFAVFTGVVSAVMVQKLKGGLEVKEIELEELEGHIIICGWHRSTSTIIEEFHSDPAYRRIPIVLIAEFEQDPPLNASIIDTSLVYVVKDDYTGIDVLKKAGIQRAAIAFILPDKTKPRTDQDRDARTVMTALIMEKLNRELYTCVELLNRDNESYLEMAGVEEVIVSDEYAGNMMANAAKNHGIVPVLNELFTSKFGNQFYRLPVPSQWVGKPLFDFFGWLKKNHNATLISVDRGKMTAGGRRRSTSDVNPSNDYRFEDGDYIIVISKNSLKL